MEFFVDCPNTVILTLDFSRWWLEFMNDKVIFNPYQNKPGETIFSPGLFM